MMNKVILMGRLTRDPEVRYSQSAEPLAIARYTLAVDRRGRRDASGNDQTADFIPCVAFGKAGEDFAESKRSSDNSGDSSSSGSSADNGFMSIPEGIENDLPFT